MTHLHRIERTPSSTSSSAPARRTRPCAFLGIALASIVLLLANVSISQELQRPNIVFAFADDWGRYASAYAALRPGGPSDLIDTPNFDAVAKQGVLFTNAFVNAPSCTPCRSSLLSGQYFWRTGRGAILQGAHWDTSIPSYPMLLRDAGYHIGHTYKVWSPGENPNAPYGGKQYAYNRAGAKFNGFSQRVSQANDIDQAKAELLDEVRMNFKQFLSASQPGKPFCYWFGPTNCHRKWIEGSGRRLWELNPDDLKGKLPKFLPDVPVVRQDFCDYLGEVMAFDASLGILIEELKQSGEWENTLFVISGDHGAPGFPNGKCNLYDFGTHVSLAISWPAKIPGDRVVDDFVSLPDLAATFVDAAGLPIPKEMTANSLLSILCGNRSGIVDSQRDSVLLGRERHVAAARDDNMPYPQRAIRTKDYLYIRNFKPDRWPMGTGPGMGQPNGEMPSYELLREQTVSAFGDLDASPTKAWIITHRHRSDIAKYFDIAFARRPAEELYVLANDPDQINNRANDPALADVKAELSHRLIMRLTQTGDPRVIEPTDTYDKPPFAGPTE
ncbi:MAG: sulfatase [Pirellulaceae bacterium]